MDRTRDGEEEPDLPMRESDIFAFGYNYLVTPSLLNALILSDLTHPGLCPTVRPARYVPTQHGALQFSVTISRRRQLMRRRDRTLAVWGSANWRIVISLKHTSHECQI